MRVTYQFHPSHAFNLEAFDSCIAQTLRFIRDKLGAYPYDTLRIVEIPFYQDASYTSANLIALSEKEGWFADYSVDEVQSFVQSTLGRELIRQWLFQQGQIADVEGAGMLWRALPSVLSGPISFDAMNASLREWLDSRQNAPLVFTDLYADLKTRHPLDESVLRLFETVEVRPEL